MRNPFPKIGKVIKYDLKHSSKRLLPLYGVLLILGLLVGLFISPDRFMQWDSDFYKMGYRDFITVSLVIAYGVFSCVAEIMTIVAIARRFKQSMLEEEAYMNLSLPVTMGEHLWGKFITSFIWLFCCGFVNLISGIFCLIRLDLPNIIRQIAQELPDFNQELMQYNLSIGKIFGIALLFSIALSCFIITLIYVVNSFALVIKSRRSFWKVLIIVGLFYINGWIFRLVPVFETSIIPDVIVGEVVFRTFGLFSFIFVLISAVYFAVTHYMFTKQLNLD